MANGRLGIAAAFVSSVVLCVAAAANAEEVAVASGHPNWPPYTWQDGDRITGIGAELAEIIFRDIGVTIRSKPTGNWKRVQAEAASGDIDVIVGIYLTQERTKYLSYIKVPYLQDANVLWVAKGKAFRFGKWDDLIGKRGTAMLGESYGEEFDKFIKEKLTVEWTNTPRQSLRKLELGRADYYPFSLYGGQIQVRQLGLDNKIEHLPRPISTEGAYIGVSKKSRFVERLPQLEQAMTRRVADGTVDRLLRKYIALAAKAKAAP